MRHLLTSLLPFGALGLLLVAIADDSFLFLPIGPDLVTVLLVAGRPAQFLTYVLAGAAGSMIGVFLLDLVCRKGGQAGLKRLMKPKLLGYLKQRMKQHALIAILLACLSPPPFPFGAVLAVASAFQYPRARLLLTVFVARGVRFALVGWAALAWGPSILHVTESTGFLWFMGGFIALSVIGSAASIIRWISIARSR